jgi:hypothetical protein
MKWQGYLIDNAIEDVKIHYHQWEVGQFLEVIINPLLEVPFLGYG